jgi:hypothetical protein
MFNQHIIWTQLKKSDLQIAKGEQLKEHLSKTSLISLRFRQSSFNDENEQK